MLMSVLTTMVDVSKAAPTLRGVSSVNVEMDTPQHRITLDVTVRPIIFYFLLF